VALDLEDVRIVERGLIVSVGRSRREKNDQDGNGRKLAVFPGSRRESCPVRALGDWLEHRGRVRGPLFTRVGVPGLVRLQSQAVWHSVKHEAAAAGLDAREFGAHSLRAGMVTILAENGESDSGIMQRSGHKSVSMVATYRRHADLFWRNPLAKAL
jgi:integrase